MSAFQSTFDSLRGFPRRLSDAARCLTVKSIAVFEYKIGQEYIDVIGAAEE